MKRYVGSKIILAEPMDECLFLSSIKGQDVSNRETRPGYKVQYEDGYISWSPSDVFERCYRPITDQEIDMITDSLTPVKNN